MVCIDCMGDDLRVTDFNYSIFPFALSFCTHFMLGFDFCLERFGKNLTLAATLKQFSQIRGGPNHLL